MNTLGPQSRKDNPREIISLSLVRNWSLHNVLRVSQRLALKFRNEDAWSTVASVSKRAISRSKAKTEKATTISSTNAAILFASMRPWSTDVERVLYEVEAVVNGDQKISTDSELDRKSVVVGKECRSRGSPYH